MPITQAALALVAIVGVTSPDRPASTATGPQSSTPDAVQTAADLGRILGSDKAKVWLLIASDFQCPFCRQWHSDTWEQIRAEYVSTGKIRVAYVHLPLGQHPNARPTAIASMCASAQGKFWPMADRIFRTQDQWKDLADPWPLLESLGRAVGVDAAKFRACRAHPGIGALVEGDRVRMGRAGAASTPTFFIGARRLEGALPMAEFRRVIDAELAASGGR
ncbi:MAG: thioredoxin domain-containing protein [Gemmatimonadota bacterium]|nr:thioredoxin domain-containing protein [Gemmatimonadota bacterium]